MKKIKLIYILGRAFTGSTILETVLNSHSNIFGAGEIHYINKFIANEIFPCTCGKLMKECDIWGNVLKSYKDIAESENLKEIYNFSPITNYYELFFNGLNKFLKQKDIADYYFKNYYFFEALQMYSKKEIIVDASKHPLRLFLLKKSNLFEIKVIYTYRDYRASIESFKKRKTKYHGSIHRMLRAQIGDYFLQKTLKNNFNRNDYYGLSYERLTNSFNEEIESVFSFLDIPFDKNIFINKESESFFSKNKSNKHILGGNVIRFDSNMEIKNTENWKTNISRYEKIVSTFLGRKIADKNFYKKFYH